MPWFSDALQGVRSRGSGLKDLLSESARELAVRTQQFEEAVTHSVANYLQTAHTARELEARLEADAKRLARVGPAAEVVQRWLALIRGGAQVRYPDGQQSSTSSPGHLNPAALNSVSSSSDASSEASTSPAAAVPELTFHQAFLRSRALEFALDAASRSPELRAALREHGLPPPEAWPEEPPPPMAFARAFVSLLQVTLGPSESWLPLLAALLSSDKGPVDDQCHAWLVQLLVGGRANWTEVALSDRKSEVEAAEEEAAKSFAGVEPEPEAIVPSSLRLLMLGVQQRGQAAEDGYRAWGLRSGLEAELARTATLRKDAAKERASFASTIALVASERAKELDETAQKQRVASEREQGTLRKQESHLREQLGNLQPSLQQTERELEQAELTRRELLEQVERLGSRIEALRQRRAEQARQEESLLSDVMRAEGAFARALATEEEAQHRTAGARALAETVAELASQLADATGTSPTNCRSTEVSNLERSSSGASALSLAENELGRLRLLSRTAGVCAEVAEERRRSRQAMVELGVPAATLESDVVGEAEISQALSSTVDEIDRFRANVERLCAELGEAPEAEGERPGTEGEGGGGAGSAAEGPAPQEPAGAEPAAGAEGEAVSPAAAEGEPADAAGAAGAGSGVAEASPAAAAEGAPAEASPAAAAEGAPSDAAVAMAAGSGAAEASGLAAALRSELAQCERARCRIKALLQEAPAEAGAPSSGAGGAGAGLPLPKGDPFLLFM